MSTQATIKTSNPTFRRILAVVVCTLVSAAAAFGLWATADRNWEQTWKDRIRVETPLGAGKAFVLSWIDQNCKCVPHVDAACEDALKGIPIVKLAGIQDSAVSSYSRITVLRKDLVAGEREHMRIYHFFGLDDKVIGHFYLPFHEIATFEKAHRQLASRQTPVLQTGQN